MEFIESTHSFLIGVANQVGLMRLLDWWWNSDPDQRYLAAATDHADLERRQHELERADTGPAFVTFNH